LPERPISDARAPFVLPEYLKMVLSKNAMMNVARFRIRGHGLKYETGLYGRSSGRSARALFRLGSTECRRGTYTRSNHPGSKALPKKLSGESCLKKKRR
jgi:hypothetical protein